MAGAELTALGCVTGGVLWSPGRPGHFVTFTVLFVAGVTLRAQLCHTQLFDKQFLYAQLFGTQLLSHRTWSHAALSHNFVIHNSFNHAHTFHTTLSFKTRTGHLQSLHVLYCSIFHQLLISCLFNPGCTPVSCLCGVIRFFTY